MPTTANTYKWLITFLVYDNAWYDLKHQHKKNYIPLSKQKADLYASIAGLQLSDDVKVVFVETNIDKGENKLEVTIKSPNTNNQPPELLETPEGPAILSNEDSLVRILMHVKQNYSARYNMIITLGHGSVFGINLYSEKNDPGAAVSDKYILAHQNPVNAISEALKEKFKNSEKIAALLKTESTISLNISKLLASNKKKLYAESAIKGIDVYIPELELTVLTINEIGNALKRVFTENPVDIFVFDNCLMQNMFAQYQLQEIVKYLVAPQSGISYPGFNCAKVIDMICRDGDPEPDIKAFANSFVETNTITSHTEYEKFKTDIENRWCLNSVCLEKIDYKEIQNNLKSLVDEMNKLLYNQNKFIKYEIVGLLKDANNQLFNYSMHSLSAIKIIDLGVFLHLIKEKLEANQILAGIKQDLIRAINILLATLTKIEVKSFIGTDFYLTHSTFEDEGKQIGLGFLFPLTPISNEFISHMYNTNNNSIYSQALLHNTGLKTMIDRVMALN